MPPRRVGIGYYDHVWEDLAIPETDLDRLRASLEQDNGTATMPERDLADQAANPWLEGKADLPIQEPDQPPSAAPSGSRPGGAIPCRPYQPGIFIPGGYIPIGEAASLLAFGDFEIFDHILETKFDPYWPRMSSFQGIPARKSIANWTS